MTFSCVRQATNRMFSVSYFYSLLALASAYAVSAARLCAVIIFGMMNLANAATPPGVTVIVHGFSSGTTGWVNDMAEAIRLQLGESVNIRTIAIKSNALATDAQVPVETELYSNSNALSMGSTGGGRLIVLVDWSDIDSSVAPVGLLSVGTARIAQLIESELLAYPLVLAGPIHLIGHSRGGSVVMALAERLAKRGIWIDHQTTLDRHPVWTTDYLESVVSSNVVFADDYFSTDGWLGTRAPEGYPTYGAAKGDLSAFVDGSAATLLFCNLLDPLGLTERAHTQVHNYYHGTISQSSSCVDKSEIHTDWYGVSGRPARDKTGFSFALNPTNGQISKEPRPASGISDQFGLLQGTAGRRNVPVDSSVVSWPNVAARPLARYDYVAGDVVSIPYFYLRQQAGMDVVISLDDDTNPFNATKPECNRVIATISRLASSVAQEATYPWQTSAADIGSCYVKIEGKTYGAGAATRHDYWPAKVSIANILASA